MTLAAAPSSPSITREPSPRQLRHGAIALRSAADMEAIEAAGRVVALALQAADHAAQPGVTTAALDAVVAEVIAGQGAEAPFVGYPSFSGGQPFPASCCISINEELVHGIPGSRALADGDVVSVDVGVRLNGWCADAAIT
ncbi:MAG: M24 family metallopeptidase, partial [Phycisphaerales bacterium]